MQAMSGAVNTNKLVYPNEKTLFTIMAVISGFVWLLLFIFVLVYGLFIVIGYLFAQSGLIAYIKGNGVKITPEQFPDLHERYVKCCQRLGIKSYPDAYLINGGGILNAFATRFLGKHFVVLYSNVVDAMATNPDAINFYIGLELGHVKRQHLEWAPFIAPASLLPLLGAAYSRAREYTCDQFGRACCDDPRSAAQGMVALAAGDKRWANLSMPAYLEQAKETKGFWMSFHELVADYPWLVKRAARLENPDYASPSRHPLAWFLALFVPRLGVGGGGGGVLVMVAIIGILAAIAIPQFKAYQDKAAQKRMGQMMNPLKQGDQISESPQVNNLAAAQEENTANPPLSDQDRRIQSQLAEAAGKVTSKMINANMRIDGASAGPGRTFTYHYTQMNVATADNIPAGEFEKNYAPQMKKTVCASGSLKTLLADDVTVLYDYSVKDGSSLGTVEINRAICG